jgi:predicted RNA-binding Zn ribbon-like protein
MAEKRAPGRLGLVQDFVNTLEVDERRDLVDTPAALAAWLTERDLLSEGTAGDAGHALAIELREALRRLLLANNGSPLEAADLAVLNRAAAESGLRPRFVPDGGMRLEPDRPGVPGALGWLLAAVSESMAEGTWPRLKVCADDACLWAFYDQSKNRSGHWCTMQECGNRAKARSFRERRRAEGGP